MKRLIIALAMLALTAPAFADHCGSGSCGVRGRKAGSRVVRVVGKLRPRNR